MTAAASSTDARARAVAEANAWLGTPYHHQASVKGAGCDCVGLLRGVWRAVVGPEPEAIAPYTPDWGEVTGEETLLAAARRNLPEIDPGAAGIGDVLVFRMKRRAIAKHCGILIAPGRFVHAYQRIGVVEADLSPWWRRRIAGAFRFPAHHPRQLNPDT